MPATAYIFIPALAVTAIGAVYDWRTGRIPNWLTLGALAAGLLGHAAWGLMQTGSAMGAVRSLGFSVLGAVACVAVPLLLYRMDAIGGGDVKMLAALGAMLRPMLGVEAEMYGFVAVALIMPARLAYEGKLKRVMLNTLAIATNPFRPKDKRKEVPKEMLTEVRFGPGIFLGTCVTATLHWTQL